MISRNKNSRGVRKNEGDVIIRPKQNNGGFDSECVLSFHVQKRRTMTTTTSRTTPARTSAFHHFQQRYLTTAHDDFAACRKITWKDAFTDARALVSGIIMASLAIYPAIHFLRHYYNGSSSDNNSSNNTSSNNSPSSPPPPPPPQAGSVTKSCLFGIDMTVDFVEKLYAIISVSAALGVCVFDLEQDLNYVQETAPRRLYNTLSLASFLVAEWIMSVFAYSCYSQQRQRTGQQHQRVVGRRYYDVGKWQAACNICTGWGPAVLLVTAAAASTFVQSLSLASSYDATNENSYHVTASERIVTAVLLATGWFPFMAGIALQVSHSRDKDPEAIGSSLYFYWKWLKVWVGVLPGVIFSFIEKDYLAYTWTIELAVDVIHLSLNAEEFTLD